MQTLYHFFRLIRPLNLLVIALTMGVFHYFIVEQQFWQFVDPKSLDEYGLPELCDQAFAFDFSYTFGFYFGLLVLSTILIAAAGNIINDYFDVKADRINKPDKVVVGKHIKRRWAIILNWTFNSIAFLIAAFVSWKMRNIWLVIIPFFSINLLWFYSMYYKRRLLSGNLIIAFLTGIVPIHVFLFHKGPIDTLFWVVLLFAGYAFWLNLIREIVKDIADVKGDLRLGSKTLPIAFGIRRSKIVVIVLMIISALPLIYQVFRVWPHIKLVMRFNDQFHYFMILVTACLLTILSSLIIFWRFNSRKKYLLSSNLLKLAMLFGLLCPLFL